MNILNAMRALVILERSLKITDPEVMQVERAYLFPPPGSEGMSSSPTWINTWRLTAYQTGAGLREQTYEVHMQMAVKNADQDIAAEIATSFHVALIDALGLSIGLGGEVNHQLIASGQIGLIKIAGIDYVGLDEKVELYIKDFFAFDNVVLI